MNEVVKYNNDLNTVSMRSWTKEEMNFFFAIIAKAREKGAETIIFETNELKELSQFANEHKQRWESVMKNVADKIMDMKYIEKSPRKYVVMALFQYFQVDFDNRTVRVELSSQFEYILNQLQANFTIWELEQFTKIRSTYAKTMYRLLKQYRKTGYLKINIEDFRHILGVPQSYKQPDMDKRVLKPIKEQLPKYFEGLKINKIKAETRGNPVVGFEFTFFPEKTGTWEDGKYGEKKDEGIDTTQEAIESADNHEPVPFYDWLKEK